MNRKYLFLLAYLLFFLVPRVFAESTYRDFPVDAPDGVPWRFRQPSRVIVIGDVHADPDAMIAILRHEKVIDAKGNWIAGDAHVVFMGDVAERGPDSRTCLDMIMRLRKQAAAVSPEESRQGKIHVLMGDHEITPLQSESNQYLFPEDVLRYEDFAPPADPAKIQEEYDFTVAESVGGTPSKGLRERIIEKDRRQRCYQGYRIAISDPNSIYAQELKTRNTFVQIGDTLFVHAGVGDWLKEAPAEHLAAINATVRKQMAQWQAYHSGARATRPDPHWSVDGDGPLWNRDLARQNIPDAVLRDMLSRLGVKRIVIGHSRGDFIQKLYRGLVINVDSGISRNFMGTLSALRINGEQLVTTSENIERPVEEDPLVQRLRKEFERARRQDPWHRRIWDWCLRAVRKIGGGE